MTIKPTVQAPPLHGLVLAGGRSRRMGCDKASLRYGGPSVPPQWLRTARLLAELGLPTQIAVRSSQQLDGADDATFPAMPDGPGIEGPLAGLLTAMRSHPESAWLVVACDLPLLDLATLQHLIAARRADKLATAFRNPHDQLPDPLCAIYEPAFFPTLTEQTEGAGNHGPRQLLIAAAEHIHLINPPKPEALENGNTPEDFERLAAKL